ncbi:hypothetical protein [Moritella sp. F3]|uniref:hypothetical protein n=1 Tax=Moritella sp. F3 TaxID=2718882 RepID=UPI0018E1C894|nr:hypothetical protein [Moritella sp. F3]GIC77208.1 hypothetical protein FMO001_19350 [Moritella sp. F1]GIC82327.1 hypothetical protein FMO003_26080 [Moritella sp. F3]
MSSSLSLLEYYGLFIRVTRERYKPTCRSWFDIREATLVDNIKILHAQSISIEDITRYYDEYGLTNVNRIDHDKTFEHFKKLFTIPNHAKEIESSPGHQIPVMVDKSRTSIDQKGVPVHLKSAVEVFGYYASVVDCKHSSMVPNKSQLRLISERLKTNSIERLKSAVDGAYASDYYRSKGMPFNLLFNSCARINELNMATQHVSPKNLTSADRRTANIDAALRDIKGFSSQPEQHSSGNGVIYDHQPSGYLEDR